MTAVLIAAVALAAGYGLGRWRPWLRLGDWANWELRFHLDRWNGTRPRQAALVVLLLATDPVGTIRTWRHRHDPPPPPAPPDLTLGAMRRELQRLVAVAGSAERPKPTRINGPEHSMPGHEWDVTELAHPYTSRTCTWIVRTVDETDLADGLVYVSTPESMYPAEDFIAMYTTDARRVAMALLAAADRADHVAAGVPRLEDRRRPA
ncbi:hypothetical protein ACWCPT_29515 [Streptomyces sp. NPDC002308]